MAIHDIEKSVHITVDLDPCEAEQLAQFLKRLTYEDYRRRAIDNDDAYGMIAAARSVRDALAGAGYDPR